MLAFLRRGATAIPNREPRTLRLRTCADVSDDIVFAPAAELAERIRSKLVSPTEVMEAHLARIENVNPKLNAIVTPDDTAMDHAREAEDSLMRGELRGPLHGVPFTAKDSVDVRGLRTTRGSKFFENHVPHDDAVVMTRMKDAGAIFLGHTNVPEFVFWFETDNAVFGRTENPWKPGRTTGGSSGGEAAALSAGMSPLGIGSDVGCSIRLPAAYCGVVGLKPTHGRVPLTGHWPDALLRFMHVGPMARTVRDVAVALSLLSGPDGLDPYAMPVPVPASDSLEGPIRGLKVGWCAEGPFAPVSGEIQAAVAGAASALEEMGCEVEQVALKEWEDLQGQDISLSLYGAEVRHALDPMIAGRREMLSPPLRARLTGPKPTAEEYLDALEKCERLRREAARYFSEYDVLLCPMSVVPAHPCGASELDVDGVKAPPRNALRAAVPFDLTGSPALSVPFGVSGDGLPLAVQIVGRHFEEVAQLRIAAALEGVDGAGYRRPPI